MRVPPQYVDGFVALARMSVTEFEDVGRALETTPMTLDMHSVSQALRNADEANGTLPEVVESLISFAGVPSSGRLYEAVKDLASSSDLDDLDDAERETLRARVQTMLEDGPLRLLSKAMELAGEYENVFLDASVLTDIRPVFKRDVADGMDAALVTHTLAINYLNSQEHGEKFVVALDEADLRRLKDAVIRAETKNESAKAMLQQLGVAYMGPEVPT